MDLKNILSELHRIEALVDGWRTKEQISTIERDLALDKLKSLYEAVRFAEASAQESPTAPAEPESEPEPVKIPMESEPLPADEPAVIDFDDLMPLEEPILKNELPAEEPIEEFAEEPVQEPAEEPVQEPVKEPVQEPAEESVAEPEPMEETKAPVVQNSLFDVSEMPIHRRTSRRVLLSLYGEAPEPRSSRRKAKEEPELMEPEAAEQLLTTPSEEEQPRNPLKEAMREELIAEKPNPDESPLVAEPSSPESENASDPEPIFREEEVTTIPLPRPSEEAAAPVLGEVIHAEQQTLADTFTPQPTVASSLSVGGGSLKDHIALNDRYLLRKELFGDSEREFHAAIEELDRMPSLDDCMIYIAENYNWNANSEAAKLLVDLLVRKYGE